MSERYKGRTTAKQIERQFPCWVDVPIPEGGLGLRLNEMHGWHSERGVPVRMGSGGLWVARFCFADKADAEAFALAFGLTLNLAS